MHQEIADQVERVAKADAEMAANVASILSVGRPYWECGYIDVSANAIGAEKLDEVFGCQSFWGESLQLCRRYFSEDDKATLQLLESTLAARYPQPNRLRTTSFASFDVTDGPVLDNRECAPFDASDADWPLEGEVACV